MDKFSNNGDLIRTEFAEIVEFLSLGSAEVISNTGTILELKKKGEKSLQISVKALACLARRGWVSRTGKILKLTDKGSISDCTLKQETKLVELVENGEVRNVTRVVAESPIDYLVSRKDKNGVAFLSNIEWSAGDRLRSDFTRANMLPSIGMRWGEPTRTSGGGGGGTMQTDAAIAARIRVTKAIEAIGPEFSGLLIDVCCFLKGLELVEAERGWPQRSAKVMLRAGLSILARHYASPVKTNTKIRGWGAEDFRPSL